MAVYQTPPTCHQGYLVPEGIQDSSVGSDPVLLTMFNLDNMVSRRVGTDAPGEGCVDIVVRVTRYIDTINTFII